MTILSEKCYRHCVSFRVLLIHLLWLEACVTTKKKPKKIPKKICSLKTDSKISGCKIRKMTKKWLWNFVTFYVDDHVWISRKLMYRCFMLSLSFQGGLFNLLGFAVEQNSATNSLRGTVRKKEEKWGRKVILACIPKNLHMNVHVCTSLCAKKKKCFPFYQMKELCLSRKDLRKKKNIYISWLLSDSTEIQANPRPLKSWYFLYSQDKALLGTYSAPQLSGLEQLSPKPQVSEISNLWIWLAVHWAGFASRTQAGIKHQRTILTWTGTPHPTNILCRSYQHKIHWNFVIMRS